MGCGAAFLLGSAEEVRNANEIRADQTRQTRRAAGALWAWPRPGRLLQYGPRR